MKKEIVNCLTWYANSIASTTIYTDWSDEFCRQVVKKATERFLEKLKKYIDFENLTEEEALELRFGQWSENEPDLYLIPLYLLPILPIGTEVTCINGEKLIYDGHNINTDIRFGCLAYGIGINTDIRFGCLAYGIKVKRLYAPKED